MFFDKLKQNEDKFILQEEIDALDEIVDCKFLSKLSLAEMIDLGYFLNSLVWKAFESGKNYDLLTDKVNVCYEYIRGHFSSDEFDTIDTIWFLISLATMTFELTYQYEKVAEIMRLILTLKSTTNEQESVALKWLIASQVVPSDEKDIYRLKNMNRKR